MIEGNQERLFSEQPAHAECEGRAQTPDKIGGQESSLRVPHPPSLGAIQLCRGRRRPESGHRLQPEGLSSQQVE